MCFHSSVQATLLLPAVRTPDMRHDDTMAPELPPQELHRRTTPSSGASGAAAEPQPSPGDDPSQVVVKCEQPTKAREALTQADLQDGEERHGFAKGFGQRLLKAKAKRSVTAMEIGFAKDLTRKTKDGVGPTGIKKGPGIKGPRLKKQMHMVMAVRAR